MKRFSEAVMNGHVDKFCDLVADRIVLEVCRNDKNARVQVEVSVWSDIIFLSGGIWASRYIRIDVNHIIRTLGDEIGYIPGNPLDVNCYRVMDHIRRNTVDNSNLTFWCDDQCIVTGYAGYDALTRFLPPEHFLVWHLREVLIESMKGGALQGQGPDGKVLAVIREEFTGWKIDQVVVTLQQQEELCFTGFLPLVDSVVCEALERLAAADCRWKYSPREVNLLINPNGPLIRGGSVGDNGQTGRKLVMDFYGPRIPIGGGALYGKDLFNIDRLGNLMARRFALDLVRTGSPEALVRVCYAPGFDEPLSIDISASRRPSADPEAFFRFSSMRERLSLSDLDYDLTALGTFYNPGLSFNQLLK